MKRIITGEDAKIIDSISINEVGIPSVVLMERAALSVFDEIKGGYYNYLVVCGCGNNGADGLALARMLHLAGENVTVLLMSDKEGTSEYACQLNIICNLGMDILYYMDEEGNIDFDEYDCIVDAIFGIGLIRDIEGTYKDVINEINMLDSDVISIDIPSGVNASDGKICGTSIKADLTVTFGSEKIGHLVYPGKQKCGKIITRDIGFSPQGYEAIKSNAFALEIDDLSMLPEREERSNKGTYGKLLVIAGSKEMSGAAFLSGMAAYKMGIGLVNIMTEISSANAIKTMIPEAVLTLYDEDNPDIDKIKEVIEKFDYIVIGPGLSKSETAKSILSIALDRKAKTVIDADAINLISECDDLKAKLHNGCILTPHMGEASRLLNKEIMDISDNVIDSAFGIASRFNVTCVLKDANTITAFSDGKVFINTSGNNGMSTAGSGDVLAGIIGALIAQKIGVYATPLGAYIHGLCGDMAADRGSKTSLMARDIIDMISYIVK